MSDEEDHARRRRATVEEINRFYYRLVTLGVHYATAVEGSNEQFFRLVDDALSLPPTRVLQSGIMFWAGVAREQGRLFQNVWNTLATPSRPAEARSRVIDGRITFFLDQYSQASAPVLTDIPQSEDVTSTDLWFGNHKIPGTKVAFSGSSVGGEAYVVSLSDLQTLAADLPPGRYVGKLTWQKGKRSQIIEAHLTQTPE